MSICKISPALRSKKELWCHNGQRVAVRGSFRKTQAQRNSQGSTVQQREPFNVSCGVMGWDTSTEKKEEREHEEAACKTGPKWEDGGYAHSIVGLMKDFDLYPSHSIRGSHNQTWALHMKGKHCLPLTNNLCRYSSVLRFTDAIKLS